MLCEQVASAIRTGKEELGPKAVCTIEADAAFPREESDWGGGRGRPCGL
jgi:hypothetical protein